MQANYECNHIIYHRLNNVAHHENVLWLCSRSYHGVVMSDIEQVHTALGVGKRTDSQAIGGVELFHQEVTANLDDL